MNIYIDADALPAIAKELLIRTAQRTGVQMTFVANAFIRLPPVPNISMKVVAQGFDVADDFIVAHVAQGDLVITSDIPLAHDVLSCGARVLTARGEEFTPDNIKPKLNARDFMETLRGTGVLDPKTQGGQRPYGDKDKIAFANGLNRLVKPTSATPTPPNDKQRPKD